MISPTTGSPAPEAANPQEMDVTSGETSLGGTQTAEVTGQPPYPPVTGTDTNSEHQIDDARDTPDQSEQQQSSDPASEYNHVVAAGSYVDIRVAKNEGGRVIGQWYEAVQRHSGAKLPKEYVEGELRNYVAVGSEKELSDLLRNNRVLVLQAEHSGTGRWTVALHLLFTLPGPELTIRRIRRDSGDSLEMSGLRGHRNTGWILDLRDPDESIPAKSDFGHELLQVGDLRSDGSYLVVLISTSLWGRIGQGATALARNLEPASSSELLGTFLRSSEISHASDWARKFTQQVKPLLPALVLAWSQAFTSSHKVFETKNDRSPLPESDEDVREIERIVQNSVSGWMETLAKWHAETDRSSYERNYLLLAAVYNGEPIDDVHRKIASLAEALGEKGPKSGPAMGQQGPGLVQLARQINAVLLFDGRLRFPGPGFSEAVVRYFWLDRPHLTNHFLRWTIRLSRELERPEESHLAEQLAGRMVPWVIHHTKATNSISLLRLVVSEWSESKTLSTNAYDLLVMACLDKEIGTKSRRAISSWVNQKDTTPAMARTLARVFATLTPAHRNFLGRLGDLADSEMKGVPEAVGEAIRDLWVNEDFHLNLRNTLISWFDTGNEHLRQAAASAFLQLALQRDSNENLSLLSELGNSDWLARGWRAVLDEDQPGRLAYQAFAEWMDTAATSVTAAGPIFATLANAVHNTPKIENRGSRYLNLGRLGDRWVAQSYIFSEQVRDKMLHELNRRTQLADPARLTIQEEADSPVV